MIPESGNLSNCNAQLLDVVAKVESYLYNSSGVSLLNYSEDIGSRYDLLNIYCS
jgi:hypothetical protein